MPMAGLCDMIHDAMTGSTASCFIAGIFQIESSKIASTSARVPLRVNACASASRGRGRCPFGFHGDVIKEAKKQFRQSEAVSAPDISTKSPLPTSAYAPAPSANPAGPLPIGPGNFEYLPFKIPYKMVMGLEPMDPDDWILIDMFYEEEMALRKEVLETRKYLAISSQPVAKEANAELLELLVDFLPRRFPNRFRLNGSIISNLSTGESFDMLDPEMDPLELSARLVQEDLCLMLPVQGVVRFVSGAVLFPQRWQLLEKLGMDMLDIHKPVPLYESEIGLPVSGFMDRLKCDKPFERSNWTVVDDPTLFQPLNEDDIYAAVNGQIKQLAEPITVENAGYRLYTRCERETLMRFPRTGAILFTIRTFIKPLAVFDTRPELAGKFVQALDALPDVMVRYKTMAGIRETAREYLSRCAAGEMLTTKTS